MNDTSVSPAPLVEHALQSLRDKTPDAAAQLEATSAAEALPESPATPTGPRRTNPGRVDPDELRPDRPQIEPDGGPDQVEADRASSGVTRSATTTLLDSAMEALRTVSVSAQTRLADPDAFPELPLGRDLPDLGPFVELVMREAQAAAAAYREEAARETTARATELLAAAAASADTIRAEADAYGEQARAQADALLADRVRLIAELTGRLSKMAQLASDDFAADQKIRDQMMAFISALSATAREAVTEVFPNTTSSSRRPRADQTGPGREAKT